MFPIIDASRRVTNIFKAGSMRSIIAPSYSLISLYISARNTGSTDRGPYASAVGTPNRGSNIT